MNSKIDYLFLVKIGVNILFEKVLIIQNIYNQIIKFILELLLMFMNVFLVGGFLGMNEKNIIKLNENLKLIFNFQSEKII